MMIYIIIRFIHQIYLKCQHSFYLNYADNVFNKYVLKKIIVFVLMLFFLINLKNFHYKYDD